jgi:biotin synthase
MKNSIEKICNKNTLDKDDIIYLLSLEENNDIELLRRMAYRTMLEDCGKKVYLRGLIEFSNICENDCYYCGIRKSNKNISRYFLRLDEILDAAMFAKNNGYGSIVLQSGEQQSKKFIDFLCKTIEAIKSATRSESLPDGLGITLCVGEQPYSNYKRLFEAGAHRYLLRIETSNKELFEKIHPKEVSFERRKECLYFIKDIGFQLGTGVMIGLPGQTIDDLANDVIFFSEIDADMIGMGPYIVNRQTPMENHIDYFIQNKRKIYLLSLKMIAVTRIFLKDVNIASTTALQALYSMGREEGLRFGANVIMPLLTPAKNRKDYILYEGKPCIDELSNDCRDCIVQRIESIGRTIGYDEYGDSLHFFKKIKK